MLAKVQSYSNVIPSCAMSMWETVSTDRAVLQEVEAPRLVVDMCPACHRRARLVERAVTREVEEKLVGVLPWRHQAIERYVLECTKCHVCFALPDEGLPVWAEAPQERERHLKLAELRARWRVASKEFARWRTRADLAFRAGDMALADEARRLAARYEGDVRAARAEIERLGGTLPVESPPDPAEQKIDEELVALREKAAAIPSTDDASAPSPPPSAKGDAVLPEAPTNEVADDELAALKRKMRPKEAPPAPPASTPSKHGDDDELNALKRKLKKPS
jgi:hypothetical protein